MTDPAPTPAHHVRPVAGPEELADVHELILHPSFPVDELVPLAAMQQDLATGSCRVWVVVEDGGVLPNGAVVEEEVLLAAAVVDELTPQTQLLSYLATRPGTRGAGVGGLLHRAVLQQVVADGAALLLAEVEHPGHHGADPAHGDPVARLRFYARHGGKILDAPYAQAPVAPGRPPVWGLVLLVLHADPALLAGRLAGGLRLTPEVRAGLDALAVGRPGLTGPGSAARLASASQLGLVDPDQWAEVTASEPPGRGRVLLVVDVTEQRGDPALTEELHELTGATVTAAAEQGWDVRVLAVGDATADEIERAYRAADAVVVMGGEDVHPDCYGGPRDYPGSGRHHLGADRASIELIVRSAADRTPLLGICRGLQLVTVAFGGTLLQHLDEASGHRVRRDPPDTEMARHEVRWTEMGSRLAVALGPDPISVMSSHHQSVGRLGDGLRVVAVAPDGVTEALEHDQLPVFAVQWHPEKAGSDPSQLRDLLGLLAGDHLTRLDGPPGRGPRPGAAV